MTLDVINKNYAAQYTAATSPVNTAIAEARSAEKGTLRAARAKLVEFDDMNLADRNTMQRRLRATQFSGHEVVDDFFGGSLA
jgi:hypothetical protein